MEGTYDFNRTPISVLGTKALAFVDPDEQTSWQTHGVGYYVTVWCPNHYHLLQIFITNTKRVRKLAPTACIVHTAKFLLPLKQIAPS